MQLIVLWGSIDSIMVMGQTLALLVGGIDLSAGGVMTLSNVIVAALIVWHGVDLSLAIPIALLLGAAIGAGTALFGMYFSPPFRFILPIFVFTLMLHFVLIGAMSIVTGAFPIYGLPPSYSVVARGQLGSVPLPVIYMLVILGIVSFFIYFKPLGRHIFATGLNDEVARKVGVNVRKVRVIALAVGSMLQAFAGILSGSYVAEGSILIGPENLLPTLAGAFIGGVSLAGGEGSPFGAVLGGFMIYSIENIIVTLNVGAFWNDVVLGLFLLVFVIFDFVQKRRTMRS